MSSAAKIEANRKNAKFSTGPKTAEGKTKSSTNSLTHGLTSSPETIFATQPAEAERYTELKQALQNQCLPEGQLELQAFERFAFATFQADRARCLEVDTQTNWLNEPTNQILFQQMERFLKLAILQERRADKALTELSKLQADRIATMDIHHELYVFDKTVDIPASLPVAAMRKSNLYNTSPGILALTILGLNQDVKDLIAAKRTKPTFVPDPA